jgi:hypothetical protein
LASNGTTGGNIGWTQENPGGVIRLNMRRWISAPSAKS